MLETFCLSVLGSGGVAGIFFALIRHYIERRLMEVEAREQERIKYKIEQRKADEEITHATGRVLFWLHHAIVKGEHNGELEEAFEIRLSHEEVDDLPAGDARNDTVQALVALGYGRSEAARAVNMVDGADSMDSEQLIKAALKKLAMI